MQSLLTRPGHHTAAPSPSLAGAHPPAACAHAPFPAAAPHSAPSSTAPAPSAHDTYSVHPRLSSPGAMAPLHPSQARARTLSDMPLRDPCDSFLRQAELVRSDPRHVPAGALCDAGGDAPGAAEAAAAGEAMVATLLRSHASGSSAVCVPSGRGLSAADCVAPEAAPRRPSRSAGSDAVVVPIGGRMPQMAARGAQLDLAGFRLGAGQAAGMQQAEAATTMVPGCDLPGGGIQTGRCVAASAQEDYLQGDAADGEGTVAPLAAQLAKLYC